MSQTHLSYQHPESGEWAHHVQDPLSEAFQTFVGPALDCLSPNEKGGPFHILEVGFGRGLNTAVALRELAGSGWAGPVRAFGMEPFPALLEPWPEIPPEIAHWAPWWGALGDLALPDLDYSGAISPLAALGALEANPLPWNWVFLDLFSPGKHPEDWQVGLFARITEQAAPGAVLTTYTCARAIRDRLADHGWSVEVLRRDGWRDTLRARAPELGSARQNQ